MKNRIKEDGILSNSTQKPHIILKAHVSILLLPEFIQFTLIKKGVLYTNKKTIHEKIIKTLYIYSGIKPYKTSMELG
jgi:hypothetical protein